MKGRYCIENVVPGVELDGFRGGASPLLRERLKSLAVFILTRAEENDDHRGNVALRVELRPDVAPAPAETELPGLRARELRLTISRHEEAPSRIEAACGLPDPAEACRTILALCGEARA